MGEECGEQGREGGRGERENEGKEGREAGSTEATLDEKEVWARTEALGSDRHLPTYSTRKHLLNTQAPTQHASTHAHTCFTEDEV
jgi:hypothetical protein